MGTHNKTQAFCEICNCSYNAAYPFRHLGSKSHCKKAGTDYTPKTEKKQIESLFPIVEQDDEEEDEEEEDVFENEEDDFLDDLGNDKYIDEEEQEKKEKEAKKQEIEANKLRREDERELSRQIKLKELEIRRRKLEQKEMAKETDEELELLGKERMVLIKRINSYKQLFKNELARIKIPKKADVDKLKMIVEECEAILEVGGTDSFVLDSIYTSLQVIEGVSTKFKSYNLSGLSIMLQQNPHFEALCRRLMLKYGTFTQTPPEYQLIFIIATSMWICTKKNSQSSKERLNNFLNEEIPSTQLF